MNQAKKLITGITPTGTLTIGNYIGSIQQILKFSQTYNSYVFVANLHSMTVPFEPSQLKQRTRDVAALYLASGLSPEKATLFIQGDVTQHLTLFYLLTCICSMGELNKMIQYRDKSAKIKQANKTEMIPAGLYMYPVLMAADIMLYNVDIVPVGQDQKQHLELTQLIIKRFNKRFKTKFNVPQYICPQIGAKIMSLNDPTKKMSKSSEQPLSYISLLDEPKVVEQKIRVAITDNENNVSYDIVKKPAIANLLTIYHAISGIPLQKVVAKFENENYSSFKKSLVEQINTFLAPIQTKFKKYQNPEELIPILKKGNKIARERAQQNLNYILDAIGVNYGK